MTMQMEPVLVVNPSPPRGGAFLFRKLRYAYALGSVDPENPQSRARSFNFFLYSSIEFVMELKSHISNPSTLDFKDESPVAPSIDKINNESNTEKLSDEKKHGAPPEPEEVRDEEAQGPDTIYSYGLKLYLTLLSLCLAVILGGLDFAIIGVAVPSITQHFHTISDIGWYSVSYRLTACAFQFAFGQLYSYLPLRWVFCSAIAIFMFGSVLSAAAVSSPMVVAGRAVAGVGSSGVLAGVFTALMAIAPLRIRPILTSWLGSLEAVAMVVSPIIGGVLTQDASWRWCFYINLPIGGLVLAFLVFFLPTSRASTDKTLSWLEILRKLDIIGNAFFIVSLTCLFMALSWAGSKFAWSQAQIIVLLVIFALCLCIWMYDQYKRADAASLPPRILKQRSIIAGSLFSFCLNGSLGVLEYYIPIYYQAVRGYSPAKSGYMLLPLTVGFNIALVLQGTCTTMLGFYTPFMIASSIFMSIGAGLVTTWGMDTSLAPLIIFLGLFGFGCGLGFEVPQIAVQTVLPEADGALGLSVTLFAQNFGGALFISIAQHVFTSKLLANLQGKVPGLDASSIETLGLGDISTTFHASSREVTVGLQNAFVQTFYIAVALAVITIVGSLAMEWKSVKEKG